MKLTGIRIQNIKSIVDTGFLELGPITLLVGKNNSGKSTILRGAYGLQELGQLQPKDVRLGQDYGSVTYAFIELDAHRHWNQNSSIRSGQLQAFTYRSGQTQAATLQMGDGSQYNVPLISASAPQSFVYPYLAGRKVSGYAETINMAQATAVGPTLTNLVARVDMLMDRHHPSHDLFISLVETVIGLDLSAIASANGKRVGMWVGQTEAIYLEEMGDGVAQLLGLLASLCLAQNQLFLIEELENDIHPEALKALLAVIEEQRGANQFVISTHNNIVLRTLGSHADTKIYEVSLLSSSSEADTLQLPTTAIEGVGTSTEERTSLLVRLGYDLSDLDLWDGWLILEESSAERIIRDHLIRWFVPSLSRVRPVAANGTSDVDRTFGALYKLVLFTHLEERYKGRVAVMVDGDVSGIEAVARLKSKFSAWPGQAFTHFDKTDFELYYPEYFAEEVRRVLELNHNEKRAAKRDLLQEVLAWIDDNESLARGEFENSAAEIIHRLTEFAAKLGPAADLA